MGVTLTEAKNLPIAERFWYLQRINKEISKANGGEAPPGSRAAHHNTAETNQLLGRRTDAPSKLRRFT